MRVLTLTTSNLKSNPTLEASGLGVAYHAKPVVAAAADCGISVNDLTAVLYFQGFTDSEIVWEH